MIFLSSCLGCIFVIFVVFYLFSKNNDKESNIICPPAYEELSIESEMTQKTRLSIIMINISTIKIKAKQLKENTWDKNLADDIIKKLSEVENTIDNILKID